ncbi:hypothetical protein L1987_66772 [Smallanthus sonchifolius]|uniref:Uncharacterized protein n=1 Tax=Smallanthus sonchifolius TaxID=185202 RepID=A0ACB9BY91_9ASTR|nr:hypothetical protein L1987_66772 [Smallanthus sonchifolius]
MMMELGQTKVRRLLRYVPFLLFYWNGFLRDLAASQALRWPDHGINVDDENEIDGLKQLLYGRDGRISPESCLRVSGVLRILRLLLH